MNDYGHVVVSFRCKANEKIFLIYHQVWQILGRGTAVLDTQRFLSLWSHCEQRQAVARG